MTDYGEFSPLEHQDRVADKLKNAPDGQGLLVAHGLGTGKTFTSIHSANTLNKPILAITPASLRENYKKELKATGSKGHVMSYHQALKRMHDPEFRERASNSLVVFDECFVAGSLIDGVPIEDLKVGDVVSSFDQDELCLVPAIITAVFKRPAKELLRVTVGETSLVCSANHPFATTAGWVRASNLAGHTVLVSYPLRHATPHPDTGSRELPGMSHLRSTLRATEPKAPGKLEEDGEGLLQSDLFHQSGRSASRRVQPESFAGAHATEQSDDDTRDSAKDASDPHTNRTQTEDPGREWNWSDRMRGVVESGARNEQHLRAPESSRDRKGLSTSGTTEELQNRFGGGAVNARDRDRRAVPQLDFASSAGRNEAAVLGIARVDRVEILEFGSEEERERVCPGGVLYNIEVEKFRTYVVNGVVVHNSHNLGQGESDRSELLHSIPGQKLLLTATPARNRPNEIAPLINAVSPGSLPNDEQSFNNKFVATREIPVSFWGRLRGDQPGVVHVPMHLDEFAKAVRGKIDYHENVDRSNFPSFSESIIEVPMTDKQQASYDWTIGKYPAMAYKIRHGIPPSKSEHKNLAAFLNGPRQISNSPVGFSNSATDADAPKFKAAADEIEKRLKRDKNFRGVTYSNFLEAGIDPMSRELDRRGIKHLRFTGQMNDREKKKAVEAYNTGEAPVLLISSAGGEGLDLKGTKLMQIMEPHWHDEKINQVRGRAIRYKSHSHLPLKERHVEVQRFHSVPKHGFIRRIMEGSPHGSGVDQYIYDLAKEKHHLNQAFIDVLKRESHPEKKKVAEFEPDDGMIWVEFKGAGMGVQNLDPDTTTHKPFAVVGLKPPKIKDSVGGLYSPGKDKLGSLLASGDMTMKTGSLTVAATGALIAMAAGAAARAMGTPTSGPVYDAAIGALAALFARAAPPEEIEQTIVPQSAPPALSLL